MQRKNKVRANNWEKWLARKFGFARRGEFGDLSSDNYLIELKQSTGKTISLTWEQLWKETARADEEDRELVILIEDPQGRVWGMKEVDIDGKIKGHNPRPVPR